MFYIVALTLIMQIIFAIATTTTDNVVSRRLIKVALKTFCDSQKHTIHSAIERHLERPGLHFGRDAVLQKITELIESNRISPEDIDKIKIMMKDFDIKQDEPWVQVWLPYFLRKGKAIIPIPKLGILKFFTQNKCQTQTIPSSL